MEYVRNTDVQSIKKCIKKSSELDQLALVTSLSPWNSLGGWLVLCPPATMDPCKGLSVRLCSRCFQAVMLDSTDVNLWYKIGHVALRLTRVPLARHAFEEGLRCNPDHWPCLDNLITVLYTLSDYTSEWAKD